MVLKAPFDLILELQFPLPKIIYYPTVQFQPNILLYFIYLTGLAIHMVGFFFSSLFIYLERDRDSTSGERQREKGTESQVSSALSAWSSMQGLNS